MILTNPIIRRRVRKPLFKDSTVAKEAQMIPTAILSLILMGQVVLPGSNVGLEEAQEKAIHIVIAETSVVSYADLTAGNLNHSASDQT